MSTIIIVFLIITAINLMIIVYNVRKILWYRKDIRRMDREAEERRNG